jgi:hypothetical protein
MEARYTELQSADAVTEEIISLAYDIVDGWYQEGPVDWEDVLDRLDGATLADGSLLDLGSSLTSPAIRKIKKAVIKARGCLQETVRCLRVRRRGKGENDHERRAGSARQAT